MWLLKSQAVRFLPAQDTVPEIKIFRFRDSAGQRKYSVFCSRHGAYYCK